MRIYEYPSKSSTAVHRVTVHDDGRVVCTCRGYSTPNQCWHVRDVATKTDEPAPLARAIQFQGGLLDEILAPGDEWIDPMLASALPEGKTIDDYRDGWILEEKYDGHRICLVVDRESDSFVCYSRQGKVKSLPLHLRRACCNLADGTYDGELYIPGKSSTDVTALHLKHELRIVLFDLLRASGHSAMDRTSAYRRELLLVATELLEGDDITVALQFHVTAAGLQAIWDRGGEGAVIKTNTPYRPGKRVKEWIKFKRGDTAEATITGFKAGKALGSTAQSIICAVDRYGIEVQVKSLNDAWRDAFASRWTEVIGKTLVFSYQEKTRDGRYRHPMADHILGWKP